MAGTGTDEVDDLVVEALAGAPPGGGAGEGEDAGAKAFEAEDGGEGADFFIHHGGETLEKDHFHGAVLGEGGEVDGGGGGGEFEVAGDGGATDAGEGAAEDHLEGIPLDDGADEIVSQVVEDGAGDFGGEGPLLVAGAGGGLFEGGDQPRFFETGGLDSGSGDQGQGPRGIFFSGHRGF